MVVLHADRSRGRGKIRDRERDRDSEVDDRGISQIEPGKGHFRGHEVVMVLFWILFKSAVICS